jgi:hypothetical protein
MRNERTMLTTRRVRARLLRLLVATLLAAGATHPALAADPFERIEVVEARGVIHRLDPAAQAIQIDGVRYTVALDARVAIRGNAGAFTLLQPGMKVEYAYRDHGPGERVIFAIEQLPDNTVLEQF